MYHYVRTVTNPKDRLGIRLSVTPRLFAAQMQYLADNGYTTLTMADLDAILSGRKPLPRKPVALTFDDGYEDFYTTAWPILQQHHFKATSYIITGFVGGAAYMTWDQIRQLDATGMVDFGAHTEHHLDLQGLNASRLWTEVDGSKLDLEQHLGHQVLDFCYPSGEYNALVITDVQRAGYETATTTHSGYLQSLQWAFTLPRIRVTGTDGLKVWEERLP
jgi:peptidoglycan/xylan/chitin deacetylase (PgdA/CDA1 family)